jgi:hypothetical protein
VQGTKIYTLDKQQIRRRLTIADEKYDRADKKPQNYLACYGCGVILKEGDLIVSKHGRRIHHLYHANCAAKVHII